MQTRAPRLNAAFYHGGEPIRVIRPFLEEEGKKPYFLAMTAAGQSALNVRGLDTVVIDDVRFANVIERGRNVLTRLHLGANGVTLWSARYRPDAGAEKSGGDVPGFGPVLPFTLLNYAYGVTRVSFREYALASWIGMLPGTILYVSLGAATRIGGPCGAARWELASRAGTGRCGPSRACWPTSACSP